ncbi:hypothetical protein RJT34_19667 [Clitoria ternatea]|uniref:Uncharacterized protein n=1 Tax=Clitoria ternatea TaxID=43366 RepID=A0AAN9P3U4_CLITE
MKYNQTLKDHFDAKDIIDNSTTNESGEMGGEDELVTGTLEHSFKIHRILQLSCTDLHAGLNPPGKGASLLTPVFVHAYNNPPPPSSFPLLLSFSLPPSLSLPLSLSLSLLLFYSFMRIGIRVYRVRTVQF